MKRRKILYKKIARERIDRLFELALEEALSHNFKRADRYVEIARDIGMKYLVRIPRKYNLFFCKKCYRFLLPGKTAKVRINRGKLVITCNYCSFIRRIPLKAKAENI
ncbi:MAG: hypothetical protein DRN03_04240 [Thermoplasmata archaeon]|nr:MAG: hypothetical protein DRN03_04240 [Thermoplasmata archaeon]